MSFVRISTAFTDDAFAPTYIAIDPPPTTHPVVATHNVKAVLLFAGVITGVIFPEIVPPSSEIIASFWLNVYVLPDNGERSTRILILRAAPGLLSATPFVFWG
jgi:hypothetical protein